MNNIIKHKKIDNNTIEASYFRLTHQLKINNISPTDYFRSILFIDLISQMEIFLGDVVREVIKLHPRKAGDVKFDLNSILDTSDTERLVTIASEELLYKLMYEKPNQYLNKLCELISIDTGKLVELWPIYVEAKARRDLGVHNSWVCNSVYLRKVSEAGLSCHFKLGDDLSPNDRIYCDKVAETIVEISTIIKSSLIEKYA